MAWADATSSAGPMILEFNFVQPSSDIRIQGGSSLGLRAGQMHLLAVGSSEESSRLADLACGLFPPERGTVRFLSEDWQQTTASRKRVLRSMIGRVFGHANWVSYLSVADNVVLARVHHTNEPIRYWAQRAAEMARSFSLPELPMEKPEQLPSGDLHRLACVRAFLGSPWLVLLEEPDGRDALDFIRPLLTQAAGALDRGAAVLWLTRSHRIWNHPALKSCSRSRFDAGDLEEIRR